MEVQDNDYEDIEEIYKTVVKNYGACQTDEQRRAAEPMPSMEPNELAHMQLYCMLSVQLDSMQKNEDMMQLFEKLVSQDKNSEKDASNEKRKREN